MGRIVSGVSTAEGFAEALSAEAADFTVVVDFMEAVAAASKELRSVRKEDTCLVA